ncbi:protein EARLY RESPONSIVE TO DEHYDRATION 15-like [Olea europaea var. sylvestris]|uniref:protein EARLY RESPONSIVE TO DEHYDRATION 15-like n=1 Tax=Olea europaea var. sylvestris TaxID=158386 RepID=UPI000C1CD3D6|nr:protein EARLY RESPONSIVE TO DEHYDRATION 15-like [Olea europaea var. sylvestris]
MATSTLNPNAPIFVPSAYLAVEDFSDQWWDLIQSSSSFRDYWLRECFSDPQIDNPDPNYSNFLVSGDIDSFIFDDGIFKGNSIKEEEGKLDLVTLGQLKWRKARGGMEMPRYCEKAPKIVNVKVYPRPIQQPR